MTTDFDDRYLVCKGEAVMGSHRHLDDAIDDARYLAKIDERLTYRVVIVDGIIIVHEPEEERHGKDGRD